MCLSSERWSSAAESYQKSFKILKHTSFPISSCIGPPADLERVTVDKPVSNIWYIPSQPNLRVVPDCQSLPVVQTFKFKSTKAKGLLVTRPTAAVFCFRLTTQSYLSSMLQYHLIRSTDWALSWRSISTFWPSDLSNSNATSISNLTLVHFSLSFSWICDKTKAKKLKSYLRTRVDKLN